MSGLANIPHPHNEPVLGYAPGSAERTALKGALASVGGERADIPAVVGGREIRSGVTHDVVSPHCHARVLATLHQADGTTIDAAVRSAVEAQRDWGHWRFEDRAAVFLKAADLLATTARQRLNAATMLGQSKTAFQAEIDSACELIDFLRFNVHYAERIYREQPDSAPGAWNRMDHRPLEGFVYAITPFNFTAIGGNLPTAPALMGNAVVWKPSHTAALSNWNFYRLLEEAGLPPGVINFLPGDSIEVSRRAPGEPGLRRHPLHRLDRPSSRACGRPSPTTCRATARTRASWARPAARTSSWPTPSADPDALAVAMVRGAYEYQGQKCSAASRAYIPDTLWPAVRDQVVAMIEDIRMGDVADFRNFMGAVIDRRAFTRIRDHIEGAKTRPRRASGRGWRDRRQRRLLRAADAAAGRGPGLPHMCEEIFGPVLTAHVYPAANGRETLALVDRTSPYALTGAVFARDRAALVEADRALRQAAGNFYVNDKPTGAVVGQQPFGGARASGTNDKAGSILNLLRWVSPRSIKETLVPPKDYRYPFMAEA